MKIEDLIENINTYFYEVNKDTPFIYVEDLPTENIVFRKEDISVAYCIAFDIQQISSEFWNTNIRTISAFSTFFAEIMYLVEWDFFVPVYVFAELSSTKERSIYLFTLQINGTIEVEENYKVPTN